MRTLRRRVRYRMKSSKPRNRDSEHASLCKLYGLFFVLFASAQILCHTHLAAYDNHHFLFDSLSSRAELGRQKGLAISGKAIDGTAVLMLKNRIELRDGLSPRPPFRIVLHLRWQEKENSFRVSFGRSPGGNICFSYSDIHPYLNGIFVESEGGSKKIKDTSKLVQGQSKISNPKVEISYDGRLLNVKVGESAIEWIPSDPLEEGCLVIEPINVEYMLVDKVEVVEISPGGAARTLAIGDFHITPVFINLPVEMKLDADSILFRLIAFAILCGAAFLLDLLLWLPGKHGQWFSTTLSGFLFIVIPTQAALLFALRACLALPCISVFACLCMLTGMKFLLLLRHGFVVQSPSKPQRNTIAQFGMAAAGLLLFAWAAQGLRAELIARCDFTETYAWVAVTVPLFILLGANLFFRCYPNGAFLASIMQCFLYYLLRSVYTETGRVDYWISVQLVWMLITLVHVVKGPRLNKAYSRLFACFLIFSILGGVEIGIRGNSWLNGRLNYRQHVEHLGWDLGKYTGLAHERNQDGILEFVGRKHSRAKPPGKYRIVCLGSSSTEGLGSSDAEKQSYPVRLEEFLNGALSREVEVINGGIEGASFTMLKVYLEEVLLGMDPDLIIIYFGNNGDTREASVYYERLKKVTADAPHIRSNEEVWAAMHLRWRSPWMIHGFLTLAEMRIFMAGMSVVDRLRQWIALENESIVYKDDYMSFLRKAPEEILELCLARGKKVVLIPEINVNVVEEGKNSHEYYEIFEKLAKRYDGKGVYFLNLLDSFPVKNLFTYIMDDSVHMNDHGYRYLAGEIGKYCIRKELLGEKF